MPLDLFLLLLWQSALVRNEDIVSRMDDSRHVKCFIQDRSLDFRSRWIDFIHVVRRHPGGLLQFSQEEAVKILASVSSGIHAMCNVAEQGEPEMCLEQTTITTVSVKR